MSSVSDPVVRAAIKAQAEFELTEFGTVMRTLDRCPECDMAIGDEGITEEYHDNMCSGRFWIEYEPEGTHDAEVAALRAQITEALAACDPGLKVSATTALVAVRRILNGENR